jgi:thioredoxin 1
MTVELSDANFNEIVLKSNKPVMVDVWAEWCGPCRIVGPIINEIAEEYKDKAVIGKLDVDSNNGIAIRYGIRSIPTILYFKDGELAYKQVGVAPKGNLVNKLEELL